MDKELSHGQNDSHPNRMSDINKRVPHVRDTTMQLTQLHTIHAVHQRHCQVPPRHAYSPLCQGRATFSERGPDDTFRAARGPE